MIANQKAKLIFILITATFFAYFSSLGNPFIWDDEQFITRNSYVQQFDIAKIFTTNTVAGAEVVSNYYRPVTSLTFAIDAKIWGQNPFGFHVVNLSFHIVAGILLFLLFLEIGIGPWGSFFITLFFLIHPVQVESVTYINSRGDSLFTAFLFGSLLLFAKAFDSRKRWTFAFALSLYFLSILSKETAAAACPLFFGLVLIKVFKTPRKFPQNIQLYIKQFFVAGFTAIIAAGYMFLRVSILNFQNTFNYYTLQTTYSTHVLIRVYTFAKVLWIYMGLLIWPYPLHMERNVAVVTSPFAWEVGGIVLVILGIVGVAVWEIRTRHTGIIFFGFLISGCLLMPVSGIIPINGILYEHWLYVPMVGFFTMLYGLVRLVLPVISISRKKFFVFTQGDNNRMVKVLLIPLVLLAIIYCILTIRQNNIWSDPVQFYIYTLQYAPDSARLHNNLGMSLADAGNNKAAIEEYKKALSLGSTYSQIFNNLGNAQVEVGDYTDAEKNLQKALAFSPYFSVARINLIKLYLMEKEFTKAKNLAGDNLQLRAYILQAEKMEK